MRQKLCRRLEDLEKISAAAAARRVTTSSDDRRALDALWASVDAWHAVPENQVWVATQPPGFLHYRVQELRAQLMEIASGHRRGVTAA
jgi:hypothetical protein